MQMPIERINRKGRLLKKMEYTRIAAVVGWRVKEESHTTEQPEIVHPEESKDEAAAEYKGAYLLISNRPARGSSQRHRISLVLFYLEET